MILTAKTALLGMLLLVAAIMQQTAFKLLGYGLKPFPYFILLSVSFAFVPIFFALVAMVRSFTGGFSKEATSLRFKMHFFVIGFLNAMNGVLIIFSNPHVPGVLQVILSQSIIPLTLILSVLWLGERFSGMQILGAGTIIAGAALGYVPYLLYPTAVESNYHPGGEFSASTDTLGPAHTHPLPGLAKTSLWASLFLLGQLPSACGSVYQQYAFAQARLNVMYMIAWSSLAQFLFLLLAAPLNFVPGFGLLSSWTDLWLSLCDAALCVANQVPAHPECDGTGRLLLLGMGSMLACQILQTMLVKAGGAALSVILLTVVTPITALAFTSPLIMGKFAEKLDGWSVVTLAVIVTGISLYRSYDYTQVKQAHEAILLLQQERSNGSNTCNGSTEGSKQHSLSEQHSTHEMRAKKTLFGAESAAVAVPVKRGHLDADILDNSMSYQSYEDDYVIEETYSAPNLYYTASGDEALRRESLTRRPVLMSSRMGIISSEYTAAKQDIHSVFFEHTEPLEILSASQPLETMYLR
eukprot:gb/GEZN01006703.1/.p1 GENE.gb/GEZN01006703.1/~~gb/GEZN01006703.1/.p1  ORF type:complete len:524 (-),score=68.18 gb/GEZN01006703.1/:25-1596(-)